MITTKRVTLSFVLMLLFFFSVTTVTQTQGHVEVGDHCDTPTTSRTILASPDGTDSDHTFNTSEITVPANTCFTLKLINKAPSQAHSFVINATDNFDGVHIHLDNATSGPNNDGIDMTNIMTPSEPTELSFYCGVSNHAEEGMRGILTVEGSSSDGFLPGFGFTATFVALLTGFLAISQIRKRKSMKQ